MPEHRKRKERRRIRDLSGIRSVRSGHGLKANGTKQSSIIPAYREDILDNTLVLRTRHGNLVDLRHYAGRRFRELANGLINDLGGPEVCSVAQLQLCRRAAAIAIDLEFVEAEALYHDKPLDADTYAGLARIQTLIFRSLGLKRRARNIGPKLSDIIDGRSREVRDE